MSLAVSPAKVWLGRLGVDCEAERLAEHLRVLASGHHGAEEVAGTAQRGHHRGELDRLRAGAHKSVLVEI